MLIHPRRLILAVVFKMMGNKFNMNELRSSFRSVDEADSDEEDNTIAGRAGRGLNLASCFTGFSQEETLSGDDQWYCNICKEHRDITKKLEIYSAPKILMLHLKRFQQRRGGGGRGGMFGHIYAQGAQEKNDAHVDFPLEGLDLRQYVKNLANEPNPVYYDLIGVSNHFGSLNGGHYTASCKNSATGKWHYFNDSSVSGCSKDKIVTSAAYILFYRKRD